MNKSRNTLIIYVLQIFPLFTLNTALIAQK